MVRRRWSQPRRQISVKFKLGAGHLDVTTGCRLRVAPCRDTHGRFTDLHCGAPQGPPIGSGFRVGYSTAIWHTSSKSIVPRVFRHRLRRAGSVIDPTRSSVHVERGSDHARVRRDMESLRRHGLVRHLDRQHDAPLVLRVSSDPKAIRDAPMHRVRLSAAESLAQSQPRFRVPGMWNFSTLRKSSRSHAMK